MQLFDHFCRLATADHYDPFGILGPHVVPGGIDIRTFHPAAATVQIQISDQIIDLDPCGPGGFVGQIHTLPPTPYAVTVTTHHGHRWTAIDPYQFPPQLSDYDMYLFSQGTHQSIYDHLGAHVTVRNGISGTQFAVWAPNARRVSVIGDWNGWDGRIHPMQSMGHSGIWALFIPNVGDGTIYKYEIKTQFGHNYQKADPYAFGAELRPKTGSIVTPLDHYPWSDESWMAKRKSTNWLEAPVSIYEVHLGSWRRNGSEFLSYAELAPQLADYCVDLGYTHVELLPITEHPFDGSWGYQVTGYYAPTSRFGSPTDFMAFVDHLHARGIGVIMDWVPAHFPRDEFGLAYFDGTHLYEHADPRLGAHQDWGTLIFNYERNEVRNFLMANALFWLKTYHLDGLRVDAVASMLYLDYSRQPTEWVPNCFGGRENLGAIHFIKTTNETVFSTVPDALMIAEESTAWMGVSKPTYVGGLGFNFKWNMGWMNDFLRYMSKDPIYRKHHQNDLTFALIYAFFENFILSISHDEVVHGKRSVLSKMPGDPWQQFANLRVLLGFMFAHPGKKLLFMGTDFGQWDEWNADVSLDWHLTAYDRHSAIQSLVKDLNKIYRSTPALYEADTSWQGFEWIDFSDHDHSIVSFIRWAKNHTSYVIVICNFTPTPHYGYRVGVPFLSPLKQRLNTDASEFGGSGVGIFESIMPDVIPWQGRPGSIALDIPPLASVWLGPVND